MPAKKKQSRFAKFRLTTQKSKVVAVVAAFAIIGGGITVYKSFAATAVWTYTPGTITSSLGGYADCTAKVGSDKDSAKNQIKVATLACPAYKGTVVGSYSGPSMYAVGATLVSNPSSTASIGHKYKGCATIKGAGYLTITLSSPKQGGRYWNNYRNVGTYTKFCTDSFLITTSGPLTLRIQLAHGTLFGTATDGTKLSGKTPASIVNVANLTLERVD